MNEPVSHPCPPPVESTGSRRPLSTIAALVVCTGMSLAANAQFVTGLAGGSGSAVGPGGALFVAEPLAGRITRVDPRTGELTTFAEGLPAQLPSVGIGGVMDVAFIGSTAYALTTLVGEDVGGNSVVGIYRIDGPTRSTVVADLGAFSLANPPSTPFFVPTGVPYAIETYRGGFLVTDGHHNRVLHVTLDGEVSEFITFDNVVPTGLAVSGNTVYMTQLGPVPHDPEDGKIVAFEPGALVAEEIASGARMILDVEFGRGRKLYALSQGIWNGVGEGSPALPFTGALLEVNPDGSLTTMAGNVDRPTSLEIIGNTAYIVTLPGEIWRIDNIGSPPFGSR